MKVGEVWEEIESGLKFEILQIIYIKNDYNILVRELYYDENDLNGRYTSIMSRKYFLSNYERTRDRG